MAVDHIYPNAIVEALRVYLFEALKAGGTNPIGLKLCDSGEWEIPTPEDIDELLPAIALIAPEEDNKPPDMSSGLVSITGLVEVHFLRKLLTSERKNFKIREDSAKIKRLLTRDNPRGLPGWPSADPATQALIVASKFSPNKSWIQGSAIQPGFFLDDPPLDIEHEIIRFRYEGDLYIK